MNLLRQREDLKAAHKAGCFSKHHLEQALSAPVFQWWSSHNQGKKLSDTEMEFIKNNLMEEVEITLPSNPPKKGMALWPILTPYPCFRISQMDVEVYEQWWIEDDRYYIFHCEINPNYGHGHKNPKVWTSHSKHRTDMRMWGFAMWMDEVYAKMSEGQMLSHSRESLVDVQIGNRSYDITRGALSEFSSDTVRRLAWFLFDIYGGDQTVVRVRAKSEVPRSVQWHQAREHYVVLRRQQVERLRESKGAITDEDIIRSAHWRRAHLRRLSAGRFVNKRGLLVRVKRAWIGPTEWEGNDGKIYTVVGMDSHLDSH